MSGSIDTRIVQMQFQNSEFEKGIKESLKSLELFKKATEFKDTIKSFDELQKLGNSFSLAKMSEGIDAVSKRFSTMGIIGMQVLENLTNKAINYGEQMVKSLSIDQITAGWGKYEQKTKAVQQITNATGLSIEEVNEQLSKLTWFSDETSYSFTDMVSNIGKFTSMNIPLDKSVTAMQGISTWAALSGAGVQEASRAMFNLSQAIGLGAVKMQDWKSIALANMATAEFKQTAIDTAIAMGKLKQGAVDVNNFESSLSKGWFTSDVLISVLEKYGSAASEVYKIAEEQNIPAAQAMALLGDKFDSLGMKAFRAAQEAKTFSEAIEATKDAVSSGWMTTFEHIFGNYQEAKVLWTDLANGLWEVFAAGSEARNEVLQEWHENGGRETLFEGIYDICHSLLGIIYAVRDAFEEIFPPVTVEQLNNASQKVKDFGENLRKACVWIEIIKSHREAVQDTVDGLLNPVKEFKKEFKIGTQGKDDVKEIQERLEELGFTLDRFGVDGIFGKETEAAVKKFQKSMKIEPTGIVDEETFNALFNTQEQGFIRVSESWREYGSILTDVGRIAKGVFAIFDIGWKIIKGIFSVAGFILKLLSPIFRAILSVAAAVGDAIVAFDKLLDTDEGFGKALESIKNFFAPIGPWAEQAGKDILKFFGIGEEAPEGLITFPKLWNSIKESVKNSGVFLKLKTAFDKFKQSLTKIKGPLTVYWKHLKEAFGKKSQEFLRKIPGAFSNVISWIGSFLTQGIEKLSAWIETIPDKIEKIKSFFKALTMEGDPAGNKKPGFLLRVKNALQDVWKWIFGGTGENGEKQKGALQRILSLVTGDIEGALDGVDETKKKEILGKIENIRSFFSKVRSGIYYAITGQKVAGGDDEDQLSEEAYSKIEAWRNNIEAFLGTITGAIEGIYAIITEIMGGDAASYLKNIGEDGSAEKSTALAVYNGVMDFVEAVSLIFTGQSPEGHNGHLSPMTYVTLFGWHLKIKNFFDSVKTILTDIYNSIQYIFDGDPDHLKDVKNGPIATAAESIHEGIWDAINFISEIFTGHQVSGKETLDPQTTQNIGKFKQQIVNFFNNAKVWLGEIWTAFQAVLGDDRPGLDSIDNEGIKTVAKAINEGIWDAINAVVVVFSGSEVSGHESLSPETKANIESFKESVKGFFDDVAQFFSDVYNSIVGVITGDSSKIAEVDNQHIAGIVAVVILKIRNIINSIWYILTGKQVSGIESLTTEAQTKLDNFKSIFQGFFSSIGEAFSNLWTTLSGLISGETSFESISGLLDTVFGAIGGFFSDIWASMKEKVNENVQQAMENIQTFWNEKIKPVFDSIIKFAKDHWLLILVGVVVAKLASAAKNMIDSISSFGSMFGLGTGPAESFASKLLKLALSVGIIAAAIYYLGNMDAKALQQGFDKVKEILTWLAEFMAGDFVAGILNKLAEKGFNKLFGQSTGKDKGITQGLEGFAKLLLDIGIGIGIIAFAIIELSKINEEDFKNGKEKVQKILDMLKEFMTDLFIGGTVANTAAAVNAGLGGSNGFELKGFDQLAGLLLAVAAIFEVVKNFNVTQAVTSIAMLSAVFLEIGLLVKALKDNTTGLTDVNVKGFEGIAWLVAACAAAIYALKDLISLTDENGNFIGWDKALAEGGEKLGPFAIISAFIDSLAAIMRGWNSQKLKGAAGVFWSITALVGVIALAMGILSSMNIESDFMLSFAESFAIIADGTAILMEGIGQLESWTNKTGAAAKGGASIGAGISALIGIPGTIVGIVGGINELIAANTETDLVSVFESGAKIFASIGSAIGGFINELSNGTAPGGWLILLMGAAIAVGQIPNSAMAIEGAAILAAAFDVIVGVIGLLSGIAGALDSATDGKLNKWLENGAETFKLVGKSTTSFFTGFEEAIADYKSYKNTLQAKDQITFAEAAGAIRDKIGDLSKIEGLDDDLKKAMEIAETLNRFFGERNPIAYSANFSQVAGYRTEPEAISTDIKKFVAAIVAVKEGLTGISEHYHRLSVDTYNAIGIAEILYNYFTAMEQYPIDVTFAGDTITNAELLSKDIKSFGESIGVFRSAIEGMASDQSSITSGANVAIEVARTVSTFLGELEDTGLDDKGRVKNSFTSTGSSISDVVFDRLESLGKSMQRYSQTFSGLSNSQISEGTEKAVSALRSVAGLLAELGENDFGEKIQNGWIYFDAIDDFFTNTDKHTAGGRNFATTLSEFAAQLEANDVDLPSIATLLDSYATFAKLLSGQGDVQINTDNFLGDLDVASVVTRLSQFTTDLGIALSENAGTIEGYANNFNQAGNVLAEQFTGGESNSGANRAGKDMGIEAAKGARTKYGSMKSAGNYLGLGLVKGIMERLDDAFAAGEELARKAKEGTETEGQIDSPSKVFMKLGGYLSEGLAIGIRNESNLAYKAAGDLANGLAGSTGGVLSSLSSILASDIDDTPVIRPVVDLSGARLAAGSVNSMFGDQEFAVKSRMMAGQAINAKTGRPNVNQNGSGSVVAAVNGMNDKIGALGEAINGMQLIMDGKALVGHITTLMDKSLGRMTNVRRRLG